MTVHFVLTVRDADLLYWRNSLPPRSFGDYVRLILQAEKRKEIAPLPVPPERGAVIGKLDRKFELSDRALIQFVRSFPVGRRTAAIKAIMRKHLDANYSRMNSAAAIRTEPAAGIPPGED